MLSAAWLAVVKKFAGKKHLKFHSSPITSVRVKALKLELCKKKSRYVGSKVPSYSFYVHTRFLPPSVI